MMEQGSTKFNLITGKAAWILGQTLNRFYGSCSIRGILLPNHSGKNVFGLKWLCYSEIWVFKCRISCFHILHRLSAVDLILRERTIVVFVHSYQIFSIRDLIFSRSRPKFFVSCLLWPLPRSKSKNTWFTVSKCHVTALVRKDCLERNQLVNVHCSTNRSDQALILLRVDLYVCFFRSRLVTRMNQVEGHVTESRLDESNMSITHNSMLFWLLEIAFLPSVL